MSREAKTLLEHVIAGSFRSDRYGSLVLDAELLPARAPAAFHSPVPLEEGLDQLWTLLRDTQQRVKEHAAGAVEWQSAEMRTLAAAWTRDGIVDFGKLVKYLHGGRRPGWVKADFVYPDA